MPGSIISRNARAVIGGMPGIIPGGISVRDFSAVSKIPDSLSRCILDEFTSLGFGKKHDGMYFFEDGDRLRIAVELARNGCSVDDISEAISWRDFEGLAAEILSLHGFAVIRNLILTKPRIEIDVVGVRLGVAMLVDCKHWRRYSDSALATAVRKQIDRTRRYISETPGAIAAPVIVTLYHDRLNFINRVPIVPIHQFSSFVEEFYGNLDGINTIKTAT